jgi:MFS family permease
MTRQATAVLVAGFLTVSIAYAIRYSYGMLLPEMLPALKISKTQAGIIYASYFLAYTLCSPILGLLSDRYNVKILLTVFTALLAGGAMLMAVASSVLAASICFTLAGIGHSACWAPVVALVQKSVDDKRRGTMLAITTMGSGVGITLWSLVLPSIVGHWSWKAGWAGLGIIGLCVAAANFLLVRNPADSRKLTPQPWSRVAQEYRQLLCQPRLWQIGAAYLLVGFTVLVPFTFLSAYATETLGMPYAFSTRLITVIAACGMAGKLVLGILSDTAGRVRVMMLCGLAMGAGCLAMAYTPHPWMLYGAAGIFGIGFGAVWPVYAAAAPDFFAKQLAGSVIGLWTLFLGVGSILSPVVCGWTIDATGGYTWAFLLGLTSAAGSCALLIPVRRPSDTTVARATV